MYSIRKYVKYFAFAIFWWNMKYDVAYFVFVVHMVYRGYCKYLVYSLSFNIYAILVDERNLSKGIDVALRNQDNARWDCMI